MLKNLPLLIMLLNAYLLSAQTATLTGTVTDQAGNGIPEAVVYIENSSIGSGLDSTGKFKLTNVPYGTHILVVNAIGYSTHKKTIEVNTKNSVTNIKIIEDTSFADAIVITALTQEEEIQQMPGNTVSIDTRPFYKTNLSSLDIIKRTSGIKVRTSGGYGAKTDFYINGISGKQIKFFLDGVPLSALGETQGINLIPLEQTERFEIYKGVIPIHLGCDALGGAINIVSRNERRNFLDVSTSIGSFNTTKNNLNLKQFLTKHYYIGLSATYNYSANDYKVFAEVPNQFGNPEIKNVRRFHNRYVFYNTKFETGWINKKWCDYLSVHGQYSHTYDQIQNNVIMRQPYGKADYKEDLFGGLIRYKKKGLIKNVTVSGFASYYKIKGLYADTTLNVYNWEGKVVDKRFSGGEISSSGNLLTTHTNVFNTQQSVTWAPAYFIEFSIANSYQKYNRTGNDPFALAFYGFDFFNNPQQMMKNISGASVQTKLLKGKLVNISSIKYYYSKFSGNKLVDLEYVPMQQSISRTGYNTAFTYFITKRFFLKASYERATRLPDETEAFGDLMLVRPNPGLSPESSDNYNVNVVFNSTYVDIEATGFYRKIDDIIYLQTSPFYAQYKNILKSSSKGFETTVRIKPHKMITLDGNITFQDLRNRSVIENSGMNSERYIGARLPNIPYLFANGGITLNKDSLLNKSSLIQLYWYANYVHSYYLYWAVDGNKDLKNVIPSQFVNNIGVSLAHYKSNVSVSFDVNNLFDNILYDNFKVQLPGRYYSLKLRFYISKSPKTT